MTSRPSIAASLYTLATVALIAATPACSSAEAPEMESESSEDAIAAGGSCTLSCDDKLIECSEGGTEATCAPNRFAALPRCPYQVTFNTKRCARPDTSAKTGSSAAAECHLSGDPYRQGTVVSGHVCSGGEWKKL